MEVTLAPGRGGKLQRGTVVEPSTITHCEKRDFIAQLCEIKSKIASTSKPQVKLKQNANGENMK